MQHKSGQPKADVNWLIKKKYEADLSQGTPCFEKLWNKSYLRSWLHPRDVFL